MATSLVTVLATGSGEAHVRVGETGHDGRVLQHEEGPERGEGEEEPERRQALDARGDAVHKRLANLRQVLLEALLRVLRVVHAQVLEPALDLVESLRGLRGDVRRVGGDAVHDEREHNGADEDEAEKNDAGARGPGEPVTLECIDDRPRDRPEDKGKDHRHDDRRGLTEQPDRPDDDQQKPTSSHDAKPRSRSQAGAENMLVRPESEGVPGVIGR